MAKRVAPLCKGFIGVDLSSRTIERAKKNLEQLKNVKLHCVDFMEHTFKDTFDIVYSSLTFMHIKYKQEAINKIVTLLNKNGRFVLSIDKNRSECIDCGTRIIEIYQDDLDNYYLCNSYIYREGVWIIKSDVRIYWITYARSIGVNKETFHVSYDWKVQL